MFTSGKNSCVMFCIKQQIFIILFFLNQARAGQRPARAWFLEITFVRDVCMRVCVCACMHVKQNTTLQLNT